MTAEVMRTVSMMAGVFTLSLFSTILTIGAVNAAQLRWDGSFCTPRECNGKTIALRTGPHVIASQPVQRAASPARV